MERMCLCEVRADLSYISYLNVFKSRKQKLFPWPVHVTFVADKVSLGQEFLRIPRTSPVSFHLSPCYYYPYHRDIHAKPWGLYTKQYSFRHRRELERKVFRHCFFCTIQSVKILITKSIALLLPCLVIIWEVPYLQKSQSSD
jgi:hypothetical protein